MSSVTSVSTPGNSTADESKEPHDSPSDRVERLLQKYKVPMRDIGGGKARIHSSYLSYNSAEVVEEAQL